MLLCLLMADFWYSLCHSFAIVKGELGRTVLRTLRNLISLKEDLRVTEN